MACTLSVQRITLTISGCSISAVTGSGDGEGEGGDGVTTVSTGVVAMSVLIGCLAAVAEAIAEGCAACLSTGVSAVAAGLPHMDISVCFCTGAAIDVLPFRAAALCECCNFG